MTDGTNIAKEYTEESALEEYPVSQIPDFDDFDSDIPRQLVLLAAYYAIVLCRYKRKKGLCAP